MSYEILNDEIEEAWEIGRASLVPEKSKYRYEKAYNLFRKWLEEKNSTVSEKTMVAYFVVRSEKLKSPASLWSEYSMLKTMINLKEGINIADFVTLVSFLKKKNIGHVAKKSKVFSREEMNRFLIEAPDETFLMMKVVMIVGIAGACRRDELTNLRIDDIDDRGSVIVVNIPNTKTYTRRCFTIIDEADGEVHLMEIFRKYEKLRPKNCTSQRFFLRYCSGRCVNQVVGVNTMGQIPSMIAKFLNMEDPNCYTGHSFRRTSATLLADTGADILALKRHAGWKSSSVAEGYVEDSMQNKMEFAKKILYENNSIGTRINKSATSTIIPSTSSETAVPSCSKENSITLQESISLDKSVVPLTLNNCANFTINFNAKD